MCFRFIYYSVVCISSLFPFVIMSVIPLYVYTIVCLSIHQLTDICIVSTFELLQIMPL